MCSRIRVFAFFFQATQLRSKFLRLGLSLARDASLESVQELVLASLSQVRLELDSRKQSTELALDAFLA